jgi:hypothetical protein
MRLLTVLVTSTALMFFTAAAPAAVILEFDQATYQAVNGGTVEIGLVLRDEGSDISTLGLIGAGGRIQQTGGAASLTLQSITPNAAFDFGVTTYPIDAAFPEPAAGDLAGILESAFLPVGVGSNSVLLGTFEFTVNGSAGDVAMLSTADLDSLFDENVLGDFTSLDGILEFGTAQVQVAAVPEPGSLALFAGLFSLGAAFARRRRLTSQLSR